MTTYRVGTHHGVTINREGDGHRCDRPGHDCARGHLVGVMLTAEDAALVVEALNEADELRAIVAKVEDEQCGCLGGPLTIEWAAPVADSCTCRVPASKCDGHCSGNWTDPDCSWHGRPVQADPACPVHQGRRARGPKPPPLGPGCICDGSGRTCPRHGAVI